MDEAISKSYAAIEISGNLTVKRPSWIREFWTVTTDRREILNNPRTFFVDPYKLRHRLESMYPSPNPNYTFVARYRHGWVVSHVPVIRRFGEMGLEELGALFGRYRKLVFEWQDRERILSRLGLSEEALLNKGIVIYPEGEVMVMELDERKARSRVRRLRYRQKDYAQKRGFFPHPRVVRLVYVLYGHAGLHETLQKVIKGWPWRSCSRGWVETVDRLLDIVNLIKLLNRGRATYRQLNEYLTFMKDAEPYLKGMLKSSCGHKRKLGLWIQREKRALQRERRKKLQGSGAGNSAAGSK